MIASTWEAHCAQYVPGRYSHDVTDWEAMQRDARALSRVLAFALYRLVQQDFSDAEEAA